MPGRARRVRFLTLASLAFFALLVFTRNRSRRNQKYQDYFGDKEQIAGKIGGGSVLRPTLNDIPPQQERYPLPHDPSQDEQDVRWETVWVDAPSGGDGADAPQDQQQDQQENSPSDQRYDNWDKNIVDVAIDADKDVSRDTKQEDWPPALQIPVAQDPAPTTTTTPGQTTTSTTSPATTTSQDAEADLLEGQGEGRLEVKVPTDY